MKSQCAAVVLRHRQLTESKCNIIITSTGPPRRQL